jgi:hypothetical protein
VYAARTAAGKVTFGLEARDTDDNPLAWVGQFNADGSADTGFAPGGSTLFTAALVRDLEYDAAGKVLIADGTDGSIRVRRLMGLATPPAPPADGGGGTTPPPPPAPAPVPPVTPPAAPVPAPVLDTKAPTAKVATPKQLTFAAISAAGLQHKVTVSERSTIATDAFVPAALGRQLGLKSKAGKPKPKPVRIGRSTVKAKAAGTYPVRVKLTRQAKKRLAKVKSFRVTVVTTITDAAGNKRVVTSTVKVRR